MPEPVRIVIAEDHPFYGDGLRAALAKETSLHIVAEAADGRVALERILSLQPDLAIVDIGLPSMDGVTLVRQLRKQNCPVDVIFLTVCAEEEMFEEALELEVKGYLLKECTTDRELLACVRSVLAGQCYTSPQVTTHLVDRVRRIDALAGRHPGIAGLTPQERAILTRIAEGKTSKEIAQALGIATKTVDVHRSNICKRLGVHGIYALRRFAIEHRHEI